MEKNMIERFFETLMNDKTISYSLSQIGLLSLIVAISLLLNYLIEKSFEKQERNRQKEVYTHDDTPIIGLINIITLMISSLFLVEEVFRVFLITLMMSIGKLA